MTNSYSNEQQPKKQQPTSSGNYVENASNTTAQSDASKQQQHQATTHHQAITHHANIAHQPQNYRSQDVGTVKISSSKLTHPAHSTMNHSGQNDQFQSNQQSKLNNNITNPIKNIQSNHHSSKPLSICFCLFKFLINLFLFISN